MNKKGVITIIVIIILVIVGFMAFSGNESTVTNNDNGTVIGTDNTDTTGGFETTDKDSTDASLLSKLKSASVSATESGSRVALSGGKASFNSDGVKGTATLGDIAVEKTVGGTKYAVATLAVNTGGSGTFHYVVLFEEKDGNVVDKSYSLLGDRVRVSGLRADDVSGGLVVTVSYLDHDKGEPLSAAPTVPRTKILVVENGMFNAAKELNF
jgi:hypothetical protein